MGQEKKHIIYIDESGIHKDTDYSTFVLVYVDIHDDALVSSEIEKIEKNLGIPYFHWANYGSKAGWNIRKEFIRKSAKLPFVFKYRVVKNPVNTIKELNNSMIFLLIEKNVEKIFIDSKQPKWYERQIKKSLRDKGISIRQLKTVRDQAMPAVRLADALAGLIRLYCVKPEGIPKELFDCIKHKHLP